MSPGHLRQGFAKLQDAMRLLQGGPVDYHIDCLLASHKALMERYAPFKVGDRVRLKAVATLAPSHIWWNCRDFLVNGALGTVQSLAIRPAEGELLFHVIFDDDPNRLTGAAFGLWGQELELVQGDERKPVVCVYPDCASSTDHADAQRYRWLRDTGSDKWLPLGNRVFMPTAQAVDDWVDKERT